MTPLQDAIALVVAASTGVLLFASAPAQTVSKATEAPTVQSARPAASVRELCEADLARFCADAVVPQRIRECMLGSVKQLKPACRSALQTAGMIPK